MDSQASSGVFVPVPDLPTSITEQAREHIRRHCLSMVVVENHETEGMPCSGVLCVMHGIPGILTASHVWDSLARAKKLVLMLGPKHPYRIPRHLLNGYSPDRARAGEGELSHAQVPDIAFIPLTSSMKADIEARHKVFYSVDRRMLGTDFDLYGDAGFWVAVGTPVEMMQREAQAVGSLSYVTDARKGTEQEGWDYVYINLNLESNVPIPSNLQGMSGGGLWRVIFGISGEPHQYAIDDPSRDIVLQGITFLQTALPGRQLIAHGPKSIYHRFPQFLQESIDGRL